MTFGDGRRFSLAPTQGTLNIVREKYLLVWRTGILACLLPILFLLPTLHHHPTYGHEHDTQGAHRHTSVIHADFFPVPAHDHSEHHSGHSIPDDTSSAPRSQISFPTLLPKSLLLLTPTLQKIPIPVLAKVPATSSPFSFFIRVLTRDPSPPAQDISSPVASPRSPPHCA